MSLGVASGGAGDSDSWTSAEETLQIETCHGQTTDPADAFKVVDVAHDAHDLLVGVETGGGCQPHRFAACWDGLIAPSAPPQIGLELTHEAHDSCDARLSFLVRIDPAALRARGLTPAIVFIGGAAQRADGTDGGILIE